MEIEYVKYDVATSQFSNFYSAIVSLLSDTHFTKYLLL